MAKILESKIQPYNAFYADINLNIPEINSHLFIKIFFLKKIVKCMGCSRGKIIFSYVEISAIYHL